MSFLLGLGCLVMLGTTGLVILIAGWGPPGWVAQVTSAAGRAVLAAIGAANLAGALAFAVFLADRLHASRAMRRPGPKGEIAIAPRAVRQLAAGLLARELGLTGFRVALRPAAQGVLLTVRLALPPDEEAPRLAERVQELLSREIELKTGLPVEEVNLVIRGTGRPQPPVEA